MSTRGSAMKRKEPLPVEKKFQEPTNTNIKRQKASAPPPQAPTKTSNIKTTKPESKSVAFVEDKKSNKKNQMVQLPPPVAASGKKSTQKTPPAPVIESEEEEEEDEDEFDFDDEDMEDFGEGEIDFDFDEDMEDEDDELPMYEEDEDDEENMKQSKFQQNSTKKRLHDLYEKPVYEAAVGTGSKHLNIRPIKQDEAVVPSAAPKDGKFPTTFAESKISPDLKKALNAIKITAPNKLQQASLGPLLHGKDALMIAGPNSGKTINAILPALQLMLEAGFKQRNFTGCIILTPTRERALLTYQTLKLLTQFNPGISHGMVLGNTNQLIQFQRLQKGISVIVATPERLLQQMEQPNSIFFKNVMSLIIDDVDIMCEMGFNETIVKIATKLDPLRHTICISNLNSREVQKIAKATMRNPLLIGSSLVQDQTKSKPIEERTFKNNNQKNAEILKQEIAKFDDVNQGYVENGYIIVETNARFNLLYSYIRKSLLKKTIIFVQTIDEVKHLVALLRAFDIVTLGLHEGLKEVEKTKIFFEFQNSKQGGIMFVTELGLRGIKFTTHVNNIIHYDNPITLTKYLQRLSHFPAIIDNNNNNNNQKIKSNSILFILKENEEESLQQFTTKLNFTSFDMPKQLINIYRETIKLTESNFFLHSSSLKAYFAYMRCYIQYSKDGTYNYKGINTVALAHSFGMEFPPAIKE